jgi:hypothetical protein
MLNANKFGLMLSSRYVLRLPSLFFLLYRPLIVPSVPFGRSIQWWFVARLRRAPFACVVVPFRRSVDPRVYGRAPSRRIELEVEFGRTSSPCDDGRRRRRTPLENERTNASSVVLRGRNRIT